MQPEKKARKLCGTRTKSLVLVDVPGLATACLIVPLFKGYFIWPFEEENVFLGPPVSCQTVHGAFPHSLSHQA